MPDADQPNDAMSADQAQAASEKLDPQRRRRIRLMVRAALIVVALLALGWYLHHHFRGRFQVDTNDAELRADTVTIAPRIGGYVADVLVRDNQDVVAGQPLVRIDPRDYRAQVSQAEAQIGVAEATVGNARAGILEQQAAVDQARAELATAQSKSAFDAAEVTRFAPLAASGAETRERLAQLQLAAEQSRGQVRAQQAALEIAARRVAGIAAQVRQGEAQARAARAQLASASVNAAATLVRAPVAGRIGNRTVNAGQYVQPGTRLMSLVPIAGLYVVANFKETQIGLMRPGQPATVEVDALDGALLHGRVVSIAPGTGAQFSILPPQNATGNFTKIVQRVPVQIEIRAGPEARQLLVPGLSATVTVDTISARDAADRIAREQNRLDEARR